MDINEIAELRSTLNASFLLFCETFFPLVTGREFKISQPMGRESHFITIARALTQVARLEIKSLLLNTSPGSAKSTMLSMWVAWTMSQYQNSQYLYVSYGHELAAKHTEFIKRIIETREYGELYGIKVRSDSRAKDFFQTNTGATVKAFGSSGPITGQDAGLPNCSEFSGAVVIDDAHKPDEAHSDTMRQRVIKNYQETILQRPRSPNVPIIYIGQRLHEDDLPAYFLSGKDERRWDTVIIEALDIAGNSYYPEVYPKELLLEKQDKNSYVFASQFQQNPIPAGGALFKPHDFVLLDEDPKMLCTFITADTAETDKSYNDATVFHMLGLYKVTEGEIELDQVALHSIKLWEIRVEPRDLEAEFLSFLNECLLYPARPSFAAIEKKSTGVTLLSTLQARRGLAIREVKRTKASGSKTARYLEMQPIIAGKSISVTATAPHKDLLINHMSKITANNTHRHDDIADSLYDGIKLALIDKAVNYELKNKKSNKLAAELAAHQMARGFTDRSDRRL
jgi:predicted phage terminase large subunit-like protein